MAALSNDTGSLRWQLEIVTREAPLGTVPGAPGGRLVGRSALDYLDRRDGEFWPIVRIPSLRLAPESVAALVRGVGEVVRGTASGFAWEAGELSPVGLQLGAAPPGAIQVEVGLDLSLFLAEAGGSPGRPGGELALFRFATTQAHLVRFGSALESELAEVIGP